MIELRLYGQPTSTYEYVKMMIKKQATTAGIQLSIDEIKDVKTLIAEGIKSIPTIKVNDHINLSYHAHEEINSFINRVNLALLKEGNFGIMKKILVPTDFSETSWNAVAYAYGLAEDMNGVINLMHCYLPSAVDVNTLSENTIKDMKERQLDEFYDKVTTTWVGEKSNKPVIIKTFKLGFPVDEIVESAKADDAFIVMGSTGDTGAFKKFFGSISTTVAQRSEQPVFIIPPKAEYKPIQRIAYACDSDSIPEKIMTRINNLAEQLNAEIHLVHVEKEDEMDLYFDLIKLWKEKYPGSKISNHFINDEDVNHGLNGFVEDKSIDLLVMAHKQRGFLENLFHKSETKQMSINSHIPLLVMQT